MELYVGSKGNHILGFKVRMVTRVIGMTEQCCKVKTLAGRGIPSCFGSGTSLACLALPFLPAATNSSIDHIPYFLPNSCWHLASEQIFWSVWSVVLLGNMYQSYFKRETEIFLSFPTNQPILIQLETLKVEPQCLARNFSWRTCSEVGHKNPISKHKQLSGMPKQPSPI